MAVPTTPLRLQVIDRVVTVLKAIAAGTTYFYTPYAVSKRLMHFKECGGFPTYMVFMGAATGTPEAHLDSEYVETLTLSVQGWVDLELGEPQSKLCKCIRDVQKAINDDSKSTVVGSLGQLTSGMCDIGSLETDNGGFSLEGFAFFEQLVVCKLVGDWGEL
jgi:hypothetical protein